MCGQGRYRAGQDIRERDVQELLFHSVVVDVVVTLTLVGFTQT